MEISRFAEESGPDDDHQTLRGFQLSRVIDDECPEVAKSRGILSVDRKDPKIDMFLNNVPYMIKRDGTFGLIWDQKLQPAEHKYEKGEHYLSTREADRKTAHATVSFYRDGVTGVKFAVKTLRDAAFFHPEEIRIGLTIQHSNICSVYGIIIKNGTIHILLEYAGSPLLEERAWIAEHPKRIQSFAKQSFQALEVIHVHGFIHCDIKPDNIMIDKHDNDFTVKLIDFGTCHAEGSSLPRSAHTTMLYWSPEIWQALNNKSEIICKPAMDVYALALTLHFVHTSTHLMQRFENQDLQKLMIKAPDDFLLIALPETISSDLYVVMKNCLDGNQSTRMSAQEAVKQLTEDAMMRWPISSTSHENYKDSFNRMFSSLNKNAKHARTETTTSQLFKSPLVFLQNSQEKGGFAGNSMSTEKRDLKTTAKFRKNASFSGNKYNKSLPKGKKCTKVLSKLSLQKMSQMPLETFQTPSVSPDCDLEKGVELISDDRDYSCSNLLKNLALHLKEPHQGSSSVNKSPEKAEKTLQFPVGTKTMPIHRSYKFSGDKPELKSQNKYEFGNKVELRTAKSAGNCKENLQVDVSINPSSSILPTTEGGVHVQEDNPRADSGNADDGMDFVFSVLDPNIFTGGDDDIVDNLCKMLDKDDQTEGNHSQHVLEMDVNVQPAENIRQGQAVITEEPMATDHEESACSFGIRCRNRLTPSAVRGSRKRMAESAPNPSGIPEKTVFPSSSQHEMNMPQLPKFDQILS